MSKGRIENLKEDFWEYVTQEVALNMKKFQNVTQETQEKNCTKENSYTMDDFAEELLKCIDGMPVYQVSRSFIKNCIFLYRYFSIDVT